jgi:translation elongation factor EF-Ts
VLGHYNHHSKTVAQLLHAVGLKLVRFVRYKVGEIA